MTIGRLRALLLAAILAACTVHGSASAALPEGVSPGHSSVSNGAASDGVALDAHILVDQFGYRPGDPKVAVIRDPQSGYDAADHFTPGPTLQVRRSSDGAVVFAAAPVAWDHGHREDSSGDRGWWLDFSSVSAPGKYFVEDPAHSVRSATFSIDDQVYRNVLKTTVRMYFYQRSGFAKSPPYTPLCWRDAAAYLGPGQDTQARDITDPDNAAKVKDLSGGWFDAGDTNKYVTNAIRPVHQLLSAFQENPGAFTDDLGIPESGNGIPDLLDEVRWEITWLKKMQYPDGSAALKVGATQFAAARPPGSDQTARYYVPSCSSATIGVAGMFAHAAVVFRGVPQLQEEATELQGRAIRAWQNFTSLKAAQTKCDSGAVKVAGADLPADEQNRQAVVAAVYLYALTGTAAYQDFIRANYRHLRPYQDFGWSRYNPEQGDALLFYTTVNGADVRLTAAIRADEARDVHDSHQVYGADQADDLYRNFLHPPQYHWGSNEVRADYGNTNMQALSYHAAPDAEASLRTRALDTLHYFHGVNPFAKVYLSNMYADGATNSVNELYHAWFRADCKWLYCTNSRWTDAVTSECGPAPGYLPGGPVANVVAQGVPASLVPPAGQPPQKGYRESTRDNPDHAYVFNEPSIVYQAAYVELVSKFVH